MAWAVDTCVLIDIAEEDPGFCVASNGLLDAKRADGLVICPITRIELAPVFEGDAAGLDEFLAELGIGPSEGWTPADTAAAFEAWHRYVKQKRQGVIPKHPIADILIGAFALRFRGLLTRNGAEFRRLFPTLTVAEP